MIFSKVQTGVIHHCLRFFSNSSRCDLILKKSHCQNFLPPSLLVSLVSEISLLKGGGGGGGGAERLKMGMLQIVLTLRCFFPLHIGCIKAGSATAIYFWRCYCIRVENFVANVVFQGVTAFKTVQSNIFVVFLSLFYYSVTVPAKAVTADISYFGAILLKTITRVVLQAICSERQG